MTAPNRRTPAQVAQDNLDALGVRYAKSQSRVERAEGELEAAKENRASLAAQVNYAARHPLLHPVQADAPDEA